MLGLHSAEVALLNGRIMGDSTGNFTYHQHSSAVGGTSVVDYAAVSASLFANVRDFRVLPFDSVLSADHCALHLEVSLPQVQPRTPRPKRIQVHRPVGDTQ